MKLGIDYLGAAGNEHGDYIKAMCKAHPAGFAAGFLLVASGWKNGIRAARALAKTGKCPVMRLHGLWLDSHHFTEADIKTAVKEAKRVAKFAEEFPDIKIYFSPWLEHRANATLWRKCRKACREVLPKSIKIVSSGPAPTGRVEAHGGSCAPYGDYIYSYDGKDIFKSNVAFDKKVHCDTILFMAWCPACNLRRTLLDTVPRDSRTEWLTVEDIKRMEALLR
jgi:hypothetical protein